MGLLGHRDYCTARHFFYLDSGISSVKIQLLTSSTWNSNGTSGEFQTRDTGRHRAEDSLCREYCGFNIMGSLAGSLLDAWARELSLRAPRNKVIVAVANKLARIARAVLSSGNEYRAAAIAAT